MFQLRFDPRAETEIALAAKTSEEVRPGYGRLLLAEIDHAVALMVQAPGIYQSIDGVLRRAVLRRFPYCLFYHVRHDPGIILVVGCRPHRTDPAVTLSSLASRVD